MNKLRNEFKEITNVSEIKKSLTLTIVEILSCLSKNGQDNKTHDSTC